MQMTFSVIPSPAGVLTEVPESKTIRVILVGVKGASSFMNAVARAMQQIDLDDRVGALWTLHDDSSRPMSHALRCCSMLGKTRRLRLCLARNSWIGRRKACITSVCMRGTTMSRLWWWTVSRIRNSMMAGRMCWLCRFPARWFHWPPCVLGRVPIHGSARSPNPRTCAGASAWAVAVWWWSRRRESPIGGQDLKACVPKTANLLKMRKAASIRTLRYARRIRNTRIRTCIVLGGRCCGSGRY